MFVSGFTIGFARGWELALVMLCVVPPLGLAGTLMFKKLSSLATLTQKNTAGAGGVAEVGLVKFFYLWILDSGILEFYFYVFYFGFWFLDFGFWILDFGFWGLESDFGFGFGFWDLGFEVVTF